MKLKCCFSLLKLIKFLTEVISRGEKNLCGICPKLSSKLTLALPIFNMCIYFFQKTYLLPNITWFAATYLNSLRRSVRREGYLSVAAFPKPVIQTQHEVTDYPRVLHGICTPRPHHSFPLNHWAFFRGSYRLGTVPRFVPASDGSICQCRGSFPGRDAAKYINHFCEPLHCHGTSILPAVMEWNRGQEEGTSS